LAAKRSSCSKLAVDPSLPPSPSRLTAAPDALLASEYPTAAELLQLSGGAVRTGDGTFEPMDWTQAGDGLELFA